MYAGEVRLVNVDFAGKSNGAEIKKAKAYAWTEEEEEDPYSYSDESFDASVDGFTDTVVHVRIKAGDDELAGTVIVTVKTYDRQKLKAKIHVLVEP